MAGSRAGDEPEGSGDTPCWLGWQRSLVGGGLQESVLLRRESHAWEPWPRLPAAPLGAPRSVLSPTLLSKGLWVPWIWLWWEEEDPTAPLLWKLGQVLAQVLAQSS